MVYRYLLGQVYCCRCLPPDEEVFTDEGLKQISNIKCGDKILDAQGKFKTVINTFENDYNGEIISLKVPGSRPVRMTSEHPVFSLSSTSAKASQLLVSLTEAHDIKLGDFLTLPKTNITHDSRRWVNTRTFSGSTHIYVPVTRISRENYVGKVYNLQTESGTYMTKGFAVHNCGYQNRESTWKDKSAHPRCATCGSRVRTKPRSSRLKTLLREHLREEETLKKNLAKETVKGKETVIVSCQV